MRLPAQRSKAGFTLLELIVVCSILAILAGAAVPVTTRMFHARAGRVTRLALERLGAATLEYRQDIGAWPDDLRHLEQPPEPTQRRGAGSKRGTWRGPYLIGAVQAGGPRPSGVEFDGWGNPYRLEHAAQQLVLRSAGIDGDFESEDDLVATLDSAPALRRESLERLRLLNQAIEAYNRDHLGRAALPADPEALLRLLESGGYLPADSPYREDAWGRSFVPDPPHSAPVLRMRLR